MEVRDKGNNSYFPWPSVGFFFRIFYFEIIFDLEENCMGSTEFPYALQPASSSVSLVRNHSLIIRIRRYNGRILLAKLQTLLAFHLAFP